MDLPAGDAWRRLERLQTLFVRLLFCESTLDSYRQSPDTILADYGLSADVKAHLPDVDSSNFLAEARGRREVVRREVTPWFVKTGDALAQLASRPAAPFRMLRFERFLSSDCFLDPRKSLPHPSGVGPGYEAVSRYFFWLREIYGAAEPSADVALRTAIYTDFAVYLMNKIAKPCDEYYKRFTGGVYWLRTPGQEAPVHVVTEQLYLATVGNREKIKQIGAIGLQDLDTVKPVAWTYESSLR